MKISAQEFLVAPKKAITFLGMSGTGKTHISSQLAQWGWTQYSCDYEIGRTYLCDQMAQTDGFDPNDISALSTFLGKLGSSEHGGFSLPLFKERQKAYYDAECDALRGMRVALQNSEGDFIHDSSGSLCEIEDVALIRELGEKTLFVYLQASDEGEQQVLQRAHDYPKPLFFPPQFLDENLALYLSEQGLDDVSDIVPDKFSRWIFPKLFEARKPKYDRMAALYGVSISATEFANLKSADEFIEIIAKHLD